MTLELALRALEPARERARIEMVVMRLANEGRATPPSITLDPALGVVGDRWSLGKKDPLAQVTLMRWDVAQVMGGDVASFGDNLFASLDTSQENLPAGTIVRVGTAVCEVSPKPHTGCKKFERRAGAEALAITKTPAWKDAQLRGIHLRVIEGGTVGIGDEIVVVSRNLADGQV